MATLRSPEYGSSRGLSNQILISLAHHQPQSLLSGKDASEERLVDSRSNRKADTARRRNATVLFHLKIGEDKA